MTHKPNIRIPSLDGVRALSIAFVVISHVAYGLLQAESEDLGARSTWDWLKHQMLAFLLLGDLGVQVFFVISGFLITLLLIRESEHTGTVNLARFYFRRTLRIFPAYYTYLAIIGLLAAIGVIDVPRNNLLAAVTYTSNYCVGCGLGDRWYVGHSWSLSVEEQFYLLWPFAFMLFSRQRAVICGVVLVACPLLRGWHQLTTGDVNVGFMRFELVADSLATGCLLATLRPQLHRSVWYSRLLASPAFAAVPVSVLLLVQLAKHPSVHSPLLFVLLWRTWMNIAIAISIDWAIVNSHGRVGRLLNQTAVAHVGVMSYSIYLWHMPFVDPAGTLAAQRLPWNLAFIAAASALSYYLVERPALRFRVRVERRLFDRFGVPYTSRGRAGVGM